MRTIVLPPSIILNGATSLDADVHYDVIDKKAPEITKDEDGTNEKLTVTRRRTINAKEELEAAKGVMNQIKAKLRGVTRPTVIGYICKREEEPALDAFIAEAKALAAEHNAKAKHHFIFLPYVKTYIATDDEAAAKEMAAQLKSMIDELRAGVENADPDAIRKAALRAKSLIPVLGDQESRALTEAIDASREAARVIAREVIKKGASLEKVKAELNLEPLNRARAMCLEMTMPTEVAAMQASLSPRSVELGDTPIVESAAPSTPRQLDLLTDAPKIVVEPVRTTRSIELPPEPPKAPTEAESKETAWWRGPGKMWVEITEVGEVQNTAIQAMVVALNSANIPLAEAVVSALPAGRSANLDLIRERAIQAIAQAKGSAA